ESVKVTFGKTNVKFELEGMQVLSRIIDERYPNYEGVIPQDNEKTLIVNRSAILSSIKRCKIFSNTVTNQIRMKLDASMLNLSAEDIDVGGEAHEEIACEYDGEDQLEIGFNARYLEDALNHLGNDDVLFEFSSPTRAGLIKPKEQAEEMDVLMLVMPLRLNN
ncbi:MAG: DNA polymerase III subunit beta, partial [Ectothiorhodospiraceae bacterium]|nr:DNA polymerase III subunit beta [Ectothiorhodospiraceae bacterium]